MLIIGIAGGSGSGKTFLTKKIFRSFKTKCVVIHQDSYYKDLSHLSMKERISNNFDHPNSIDIRLLIKDVKTLINGESILQPIYDFSNHTRKKKYLTITPNPIIIVEGVLIFHFKDLANLFSLKIFLDVDSDIRFIRRLKRDVKERKRQVKDICKQYLNFVKPMHELFVEKTKSNSDIVLKNQYDYNLLLDKIKNNLIKVNEPKIK
tara:strand:+ start:153 stop:770 length:618 start_codon:yes stop_codon:yes gene_type:complete